jgi:formylglycine-generating enzyme required for sulfatase activity
MNEFDQQLKQAKSRHFKWAFVGAGVVGLLVLTVSLWLLFARGHVIGPIEPPTARLSVVKGVGFIVTENLYTLSEVTEVLVQAKGYIDQKITLDAQSPVNVAIKMQPKPGRLTGVSNPVADKNAWSLDGEFIEIGTQFKRDLKPGNHQLSVDNPYYQVMAQAFAIGNDEDKVLQFDLTPVEGLLSIDSQPTGAQVWLNDTLAGKTPLTAPRPGGVYQLRLTYNGYQDSSEHIELTNQSPLASRQYYLTPQQAQVKLNWQTLGGTLLINGKAQEPSNSVSLDANKTHNLLYQKPGYYPLIQQLTLKPAEQLAVDLVLKPEIGEVLLQADVIARVTINGKVVGDSPLKIQLPAVPHNIVFSRTGYRSVVKQIKPNGQTATELKVKMITEYAARRKEGKPTVASQLGITMVPFKPRSGTIGSPVNEQGRRRNEFLHKVIFSRSIYVSQQEIAESQYAKFSKNTAQNSSKLPVSDISWLEAVRFCNWLSEQDGLPPFYRLSNGRYQGINRQANGYRLPTEAEWEWLARRAKRAVETTYVWGNSSRIPHQAGNFADESLKGKSVFYLKGYNDGFAAKAPVGSFKADRAGLYNLAGNVSEWVHDFYSNVPTKDDPLKPDPLGPVTGSGHLSKGASYNSGRLSELRPAYREPQSDKAPSIGFRIARYF